MRAAEALPDRAGQWPWAIFIVNLAGAFILGWLLTRLAERTAHSLHWRFSPERDSAAR